MKRQNVRPDKRDQEQETKREERKIQKKDKPDVVITVFANGIDPSAVRKETRRGARKEDKDNKGEKIGDDKPTLVKGVILWIKRKDKDKKEGGTGPMRLLVKVVQKLNQPGMSKSISLNSLLKTAEIHRGLKVNDKLRVFDRNLSTTTDEFDSCARKLVKDKQADDDEKFGDERIMLPEGGDELFDPARSEDVPKAVFLDAWPRVCKESKRKDRNWENWLDDCSNARHLQVFFFKSSSSLLLVVLLVWFVGLL